MKTDLGQSIRGIVSRAFAWLRGIDFLALLGLIAIAAFTYWIVVHYTNAVALGNP